MNSDEVWPIKFQWNPRALRTYKGFAKGRNLFRDFFEFSVFLISGCAHFPSYLQHLGAGTLDFCKQFAAAGTLDFVIWELEPSILHAICSIWELELSILHDTCICLQHVGAGTFPFASHFQHFGAGTFHFA